MILSLSDEQTSRAKERDGQQRFLELRASFPVNGSRSPRVVPVLRVPVRSQVDHLCERE